MSRIATIAVACLMQALPALGQDAPPAQGLVVLEAREVSLADYLWTARPFVVFADAPADPRFGEQMDLLAADAAALNERDVVVITDTDPKARTDVRTQLRPRGFMIALLDKDGTVVFRKPLPWDVREISRAIDKLPLRKEELARHRALTN